MDYRIPLFDLHYDQNEWEALRETLESKWISMGKKVRLFEEIFCRHLGVPYGYCLTNCTSALFLALKILGIGKGDEVLVPSLTFVATVNAIRYVEATPVFVDILGPHDFSISPEDLEKKITPKSRAILVMHYGGYVCPMDEIKKIARDHQLFIVEDCAHAPQSSYNGAMAGSLGDMGCFSFFSNKNISCGEGGFLSTKNPEWAEQIRLLRSHGMTTMSYERARGHATGYDVVALGYNFRLDDIRGALLLSQFKKLKKDVEKREHLRKYYIQGLAEIDEIEIPYQSHPHPSSHYIFPVILKKGNAQIRQDLRQYLASSGIQTSVHYPAVHRFSIYQSFPANLPQTEYVADCEITLPLYYHLKEEEIDYIVEKIKEGLLVITKKS
ncbi:MAG: DegT/DnrJ/EryC1/StrS family aminotransferase [Planctomycetota bacterium]|nr:MAG: DegT/DnrJ/EryC1/StrS family aminotransferase [Planctomycetota bacterium]